MMSEIIEAEYREVLPEEMNVLAGEIRVLSRTVYDGIIEIGRRFARAKSICPRGAWEAWVLEVTGYKLSMAENYIKVFREYGGEQLNVGGDFSKSQSIVNLGITKLLELTAIPAEERIEFAEKHNADSLTVKELQEVIKAEREKAGTEKKSYEDRILEKEAQAEKLRQEADRYTARISELEAQLKAAEERTPELPQSELDRFYAEAEAAAKKEMEAELDKLRKKADTHKGKLEKTQADCKKLKDQLKRAKDEIAAADRDRDSALLKAKTAEKLRQEADSRNKELEAEIEELKRVKPDTGVPEDLVKVSVKFQDIQDEIAELFELIDTVSGADKYRVPVVEALREQLAAAMTE